MHARTSDRLQECFALAQRVARIEPFHVMELAKRAHALQQAGRSVISLGIGEPDFTAPAPVLEAMAQALRDGRSGYTHALGIMALREAIAGHYREHLGVGISAERIAITAGGSGALLLTMAAIIEPGTEVLMPDPCYPCNRHFVSVFGGTARLIPTAPEERFQLTAAQVDDHWGNATRAVLIASPANPTGTSIPAAELRAIASVARRRGGWLIVDEIYQSLCYDGAAQSALGLLDGDDDNLIVVNSFSKYFNMTGWRLGWLVLPQTLVPVIEKLAQNLYICAPGAAQHAALACFSAEAQRIYEERKAQFARRRDHVIPALETIGFAIPAKPDGAFYIYADCRRFSADSTSFAYHLLDHAGVAVVPGMDFGSHGSARWLRFSYATSMENLEEALRRLRELLLVAPRRA